MDVVTVATPGATLRETFSRDEDVVALRQDGTREQNPNA
jgi:hypothetical protein